MLLSELDKLARLLVSSSLRSILEAKAFLWGISTGYAVDFPNQKEKIGGIKIYTSYFYNVFRYEKIPQFYRGKKKSSILITTSFM